MPASECHPPRSVRTPHKTASSPRPVLRTRRRMSSTTSHRPVHHTAGWYLPPLPLAPSPHLLPVGWNSPLSGPAPCAHTTPSKSVACDYPFSNPNAARSTAIPTFVPPHLAPFFQTHVAWTACPVHPSIH